MPLLDGSFARNGLVPLLLRLTLGAIFIYHGVDKIHGTQNDWGSQWAVRMWERDAYPPPPVMDHLRTLARENPEQRDQVHDVAIMLQAAYTREAGTIPPGIDYALTQLLVAWGELLCGAALLVGFLTRLAAALMIVVQLGAIFTVTWQRGFSFAAGGGYEYNICLMVMCFALILSGSGTLLSLNRLFLRRGRAESAGVPAVARAGQHQPIA